MVLHIMDHVMDTADSYDKELRAKLDHIESQHTLREADATRRSILRIYDQLKAAMSDAASNLPLSDDEAEYIDPDKNGLTDVMSDFEGTWLKAFPEI